MPAELLLVLVALLVAVEDLRHRSVSPVHDPHAVLDAGGAPEAEIALLAVLAQAQVREVGRERVHFGAGARAPQLLEQRALAVPLLGERERVLALAARDDLLAQALELALERALVVARLLGCAARGGGAPARGARPPRRRCGRSSGSSSGCAGAREGRASSEAGQHGGERGASRRRVQLEARSRF